MRMTSDTVKRTRLGPIAQKVLLLLEAGIILALTTRPDSYFRVVKKAAKEWEKINSRSLHEAVKRLYRSRLIDYKEHHDGAISLTLTENGKHTLLRYHLDTMEIPKPARWDGLWRMILFDIPERFKVGRDALAQKLKDLGFRQLQKSVFVFPYECKNEVDFIIEIFNLRPFVRFAVLKEIDVALDLQQQFHLK